MLMYASTSAWGGGSSWVGRLVRGGGTWTGEQTYDGAVGGPVPGVEVVGAAQADDVLHLRELDGRHGVICVGVPLGEAEESTVA